MGGHKPGDNKNMFETAFSPFCASWGLGVATARPVVENQCGGTTRELWGMIMGHFRGRRPFRKLIFGNLVTWFVSPHYRAYGCLASRFSKSLRGYSMLAAPRGPFRANLSQLQSSTQRVQASGGDQARLRGRLWGHLRVKARRFNTPN